MTQKVDDYIFNLSEKQQTVATHLRNLFLELVPQIQEKLSFKIPFYHHFGMFCYLNSIPNGIDLCFCRGKDFASDFAGLELKGRAIVASVSLYSLRDIKTKEVREIIITAALWNEEAKKKKIPMVKKRKV